MRERSEEHLIYTLQLPLSSRGSESCRKWVREIGNLVKIGEYLRMSDFEGTVRVTSDAEKMRFLRDYSFGGLEILRTRSWACARDAYFDITWRIYLKRADLASEQILLMNCAASLSSRLRSPTFLNSGLRRTWLRTRSSVTDRGIANTLDQFVAS